MADKKQKRPGLGFVDRPTGTVLETPFGMVGSPETIADLRLEDANYNQKPYGDAALWAAIQAGLNAPGRGDPYDARMASATRPGELAALDALHNGPSAVVPMVSRSFSGAVTGTNNAVANAGGGLQAALAGQSALNPMSQLADQAGAGRLQEFMGQQSAYGQGLQSLRGRDQKIQSDQFDARAQGQQQDDLMQQFYINQGMSYDEAKRRSALENYKLKQRLKLAAAKGNVQTGADVAQGAATVAGL